MDESFLTRMQKSSHLSGGSVAYIETLYERFLEDPNSISEEWRSTPNKNWEHREAGSALTLPQALPKLRTLLRWV